MLFEEGETWDKLHKKLGEKKKKTHKNPENMHKMQSTVCRAWQKMIHLIIHLTLGLFAEQIKKVHFNFYFKSILFIEQFKSDSWPSEFLKENNNSSVLFGRNESRNLGQKISDGCCRPVHRLLWSWGGGFFTTVSEWMASLAFFSLLSDTLFRAPRT